MTGIAVTSLVVIGGNFVFQRVDSEIQTRLTRLIQEKFPSLAVRIRSTRRIEGKGIEVRGLSLLGRESRELLYVDELFLECDVAVTDLLSGATELRAITARRMRLSGHRDVQGKWNLSELWQISKSSTPARIPPIHVVDGTIVLTDVSSDASSEQSWVLRDVQFSLTDQPRDSTHEQLQGELQRPLFLHLKVGSEHFHEMAVYGALDARSKLWRAAGHVRELQVNEKLLRQLPKSIANKVAGARIQGKANLRFSANNLESLETVGPATIPFAFDVAGELTQARITDPRLPAVAIGVECNLRWDNLLIDLSLVTAKLDGAAVKGRFVRSNWQHPNAGFTASLSATSLTLRPGMADVMPFDAASYWRKVAPVGRANLAVQVRAAAARAKWTVAGSLELLDVAFSMPDFPYRLDHGSGMLRLENNRLTATNFRAFASGRQVNFQVDMTDPGDRAQGTLVIRVPDPVPIDERLLAAFDPRTRDEIRAFAPRGGLSFFGVYRRQDPDKAFTQILDVGLHRCSVRHKDFPYRLEKISGTLSFREGKWSCREVICRNRSAQVTVSGSWQTDSTSRWGRLKFDCRDVPLDEELRESIVSVNRSFGRSWSQLRPRGAIDQLFVDYRWEGNASKVAVTAHKWPPEQNLDSRTISVHPTWFPYRLEQVTGTVVLRDGEIHLHGLKGQHAKSKVTLNGSCQHNSNGIWSVKLKRLIADKLVVDQSLLKALPNRVARTLESLKIAGPIHLDGKLDVAGKPKGPPRLTWSALISLVNTDAVIGVPLKSMFGEVSWSGVSQGDAFSITGDVRLDSVMYQNVQVTKVRGPFRIDPQLASFGRWAEPVRAAGSPRHLTAKVFDGELIADGKVALGGTMPFVLEAQLRDGKVASFARDVQLRSRKISGRVAGVIRLNGNVGQGYQSLDGRGVLKLQEADLYEVPLVVALLSLLKVRRPDRNAFTDVNIAYHVRGDQFLLDQMVFKGGAVTLKGSGWMDFDRRINLTFFTLVGRDEIRIPILTSLFEEGSRRILEIQVAGTIDRPRIERRAFPELDDTLKRIFPNLNQPKKVQTSSRFRFFNPTRWGR